jgi:hypothetical protein
MKKSIIFLAPALFAAAALGQSITVLSPNGGESWLLGETRAITWRHEGLTGAVRINLIRPDGTGAGIIARVPVIDGSYSWTVGETNVRTAPGGQYRIGLFVPNQDVEDQSDATFTITRGPIHDLPRRRSPPPPKVKAKEQETVKLHEYSPLTGGIGIRKKRDGETEFSYFIQNPWIAVGCFRANSGQWMSRGIVSFNLGEIPFGAEIRRVLMCFHNPSKSGHPFEKLGNLLGYEFQLPGGIVNCSSCYDMPGSLVFRHAASPERVDGQYDLTESLKHRLTTGMGFYQLRLQFERDLFTDCENERIYIYNDREDIYLLVSFTR